MHDFLLLVASLLAWNLGFTHAQSCGSEGVTRTFSSPTELEELTACPTYLGNINLATSLSGNVTLPGIEVLKGDLTCDGANDIRVVETFGLETVEGEISFTNCLNLEIIDFRQWLDNASSVVLTDLPALTDFWFVVADIGSLRVERTRLVNQTLYLDEKKTTSIVFHDNPELWLVTVNGYDAEMTGDLVITGSPKAEVAVSGLERIGSLELRNLASLYSSSAILNITTGDTILENIDVGYAIEDLEYIEGNLQIFGNVTADTTQYGHANLFRLNQLSAVGGKIQVYNPFTHVSLFAIDLWSAESIDIAGLIHELSDSITFGGNRLSASHINFRSSNGYFDCCRYAYLRKRLDEDFYCAENVTFAGDDYATWEMGKQRTSSTGDVVDLEKCKKSEDSPQYAEEPKSPASGGGGGSSGSGYSSGGSVHISGKNKKLIGGIVGPVCAVLLGLFAYCFRRHKKNKQKDEPAGAASTLSQQFTDGASAPADTEKMPQQNVVEVASDPYRHDPAWNQPLQQGYSAVAHQGPVRVEGPGPTVSNSAGCTHCKQCLHG